MVTFLGVSVPTCLSRSLPRSYVAAGDVQIYAVGLPNFRVEALQVDPLLKPQAFVYHGLARKERKDVAVRWRKHAGALGITGPSDAFAAREALRAAAAMWLATGASCYVEAVETLLFNALTAAVRFPADPMERHVAAAALMDGAGAAYASDEDAVYVNYYLSSGALVDDGKRRLRLDVLTPMPVGGRVKVRMRGLKVNGTFVRLRLRLPSWAGECPKVYANGRETAVRLAGGYMEVSRRWNNGDEVFFDLPLVPRLVRREGKAAVALGPLAYACADNGSGALLEAGGTLRLEEIAGSEFPAVVARAVGGERGGEGRELRLLPYALTRGAVWLSEK